MFAAVNSFRQRFVIPKTLRQTNVIKIVILAAIFIHLYIGAG